MAFRADIDALILAVLSDQPMHGYAISRRIDAIGASQIRCHEGQLYPALHRLAADNRIVCDPALSEHQQPKLVYRITDEGTKELARLHEGWQAFSKAVNALLAPGIAQTTSRAGIRER